MSCCAISTSRAPIRMARIGLATVGATHLLKIAVEAATGQRAKIDVFGTDYPTPDGSCIRDFIHVSDLAQAHRAALSYLRGGGRSVTLNCGYGRGYSVLETIEAVRRVSGRNFAVQYAPRRPGDIMTMVADTARIRSTLDWTPQYDDLETIAAHALAWEEKLLRERQGELRARGAGLESPRCKHKSLEIAGLKKPCHIPGEETMPALHCPVTHAGLVDARRRQWNADGRTSKKITDDPYGAAILIRRLIMEQGAHLLAPLSARLRADGGFGGDDRRIGLPARRGHQPGLCRQERPRHRDPVGGHRPDLHPQGCGDLRSPGDPVADQQRHPRQQPAPAVRQADERKRRLLLGAAFVGIPGAPDRRAPVPSRRCSAC